MDQFINQIVTAAKDKLANIGQGEENLEKNHPLYGQLQAGIRHTIAPIMRNVASQQNVDTYKNFSQPNTAGVAGDIAKAVGTQVPYLPLMMATGNITNPITEKIGQAAIPQGVTPAAKLAAGAARGALNFFPFGWMGGLNYAKNSQERMKNIGMYTAGEMGMGAMGGSAAGAIADNPEVPQVAAKAARQVARDEQGRYATADKVNTATMQNTSNLYSPARGKLYNRSSIRRMTGL